ncbi:MAG: extracellular solute-binding protein [Anaerolineae bacterium]|nr:extracellular solute-binding protein [Anaerolineae bacterium]
MSVTKLSRRRFLTVAAGTVGAGLLAACATPTAQIIKETVVVKETVAVEKVVKETVAVEKVVTATPVVEKRPGPQWAPAKLSGKKYDLWGLKYDPHVDAYNRLTKKFEGLTGATATVTPVTWPIENQIITAMAAGLVPDVVCIMGKQIAPLILQNAIVAIDDLVFGTLKFKPEDWFSPVGYQAYQYFGKNWGIPVEGNAVSAVTNIRWDFLKAAPADVQQMWPPNQKLSGWASFEDMWNLAAKLQVTDKDGTVTRWGLSSRGWDNRHLYGIMRTLGRDWWDPNQRKFFLDSAEAREAMNLQVVRPVFDLKIETQFDTSYDNLLAAGKIALGNGNVVLPGLHRNNGIYSESCIYPTAVKGKKPLFVGEGGWGFVVPTQAKQKEVGIEFLKYVATYDGQLEYARIYGGMIPGAPKVAEDPTLFYTGDYVGEAIRRVAPAQLDTVYYGSDYGNPGEMEGIVSAAIDNVRGGGQKTDEALKDAQKQLEEMLKRWDEDKKTKTS